MSTATLDAYRNARDYLIGKGWTFKGNPSQDNSLWYDPTKPMKDSQEKRNVPVMGRKLDPNDSKKVIEVVHHEVTQVFITPAQTPVCRDEAVQTQLLRDHEEAERANKKAAEEAKAKK